MLLWTTKQPNFTVELVYIYARPPTELASIKPVNLDNRFE